MNKTETKILNDLIKNSKGAYISVSNNICYKHFSNLDYYYMICNKLKLNIKCINSLSYEATKDGADYSIDWVEHDLILAFNQVGIRKDFIFKNNKDVLIKLHIDTTHIITDDIFKNIKDMIQNDKLLIYEDRTGFKACDDYIYNTNYQMNNIHFDPTFTEDENQKEKITECYISMEVKQNPDMKVRYYTKSLHEDMKKIFEAVTN